MTIGRSFLRFAAAVFVALLAAGGCLAREAAAPGEGRLERASYLADRHQLVVAGWAAPAQPGVFTTNLVIRLGPQEIYRGRFERAERPDVVAATGRGDWLASGFTVRIALPRDAAGAQTVTASMRMGDGREIELPVDPAFRELTLPPARAQPRLLALSLLVLAALLPLVAFAGVLRRRRPEDPVGVSDPVRGRSAFAASVVASFLLLVAGGWTGSSIALLQDDRAVASHDAVPWAGTARVIRSDEWQVLTPLAIAQAQHRPAFPVVNRNLGTEGQNMLVVGMSGMPVAHLSALARPATWGFFALDLRRALAWSWWFPFFACFLALWAVLQRFFAVPWRLAAVLALTLAVAPYTVVYSGWPAYAAFFPLLGLLALERALRAAGIGAALAAGGVAGLAIAGFALVLYPAWQISLAWLFAPLAVAWVAVHRQDLRWGVPQVVAAGFAAAVALVVLGAWWQDAHEAVAAIRGTVYPGQRTTEAGGDADRWFLLKGWLSPVTMYRDSSIMPGGASDGGSIVLLVLPLLAAFLWRWRAVRRIDPIGAVLVAYLAIILAFMFVGFGPEPARWTLWRSTTSYRLDLALGAAQVLLLASLVAAGSVRAAHPLVAGAVTAGIALHAVWLFGRVPPAIAEMLVPPLLLAALASLGAIAWLLLRGRPAIAAAIYAAWMLAAAIPFNPLALAPRQLTAAPAIAAAVPPGQHVLVASERAWSMLLPAAGIPVVNSVFYVPPAAFWQRLDPTGSQRALHNRYQRLIVLPRPLPPGPAHAIASPRLDEVHLTVDPARFDFRLTGASFVLANAADAALLAAHPGLRVAAAKPGWTLYAVRP